MRPGREEISYPSRDALEAQAEPRRRAAIERIEQRLRTIDAQPVMQEHAAVIELRAWLVESFSPVRFYADDRGGTVLAPEASTTPRTIVIEVWLYGGDEYLRFTPRSHAAFMELLTPAGGSD